MPNNTYYRTMIGRQNHLKKFLCDVFLVIASYPRLLLEIFIRKDFGERYFSLAAAITISVILGCLPLLRGTVIDAISGEDVPFQWSRYLTLYIYLALFLAVSIKHFLSIKQSTSSFDTTKFSQFSGTLHPAFYKIKVPGIATTQRTIETFFEPLPFFISGVLLWLLHQELGLVLIVCSVCYSLSYVAAYTVADNLILDKIDKMILNEGLAKIYSGENLDESKGFRYTGRVPADETMRKKILPELIEDKQDIELN